MNNSKLIKISIGIVIFLILIILALMFLFNGKKEKNGEIDNKKEVSIQKNNKEHEFDRNLQEFNDTNMYFVVKRVMEKFYSLCKDMNTTAKDIQIRASAYQGEELQNYKEQLAKETQDKAVEDVYTMLSEEFIKEFSMEKQDIKQELELENKYSPVIEKIYRFQNSDNVWTYLVTGIAVDNINKKSETYKIGITLDTHNKTFCIYPQKYLEKHEYDKLQIGDDVELNINEIKNNTGNTYTYEIIKDDEICKEYFNKMKKTILYDTDFSYEMLDKTYIKNRFQDLEEYKNWVKKYYNILNSSVESKYQVTNENGTKTYICEDTKGSYFEFIKKDTVDFKIRLDTYTINTNEFIEKYNKENEKVKAEMNIEKIFQAINKKDYKYVYKYLDESFKSQYYPNLDSLEKYLENNLFETNKIESNGYRNEGNIQIFDIIVKDKNDNNSNKKMTIIIKIKEDMDFVMSFNIQD